MGYDGSREGERSSPFKWISDVCWYGTEDPMVDSIVILVDNCDRDVDEIRYQLALSLVRMNRLVRFCSEGTRLFHIRIVWRAINYYASIILLSPIIFYFDRSAVVSM